MQCSFDVYYVDENITYMVFFVICFFKQKTAYEMRISDWSSDVCSSDLRNRYAPEALDFGGIREISADHLASGRLPNPQNFFRTRASVRDYSSAPVPSAVIEEAVELALHSPSVCDRQASYVYCLQSREIIDRALSLQNGNRGFGHEIPCLQIGRAHV